MAKTFGQWLLLLVTFAILLDWSTPTPADAGANAGGSVSMSWSRWEDVPGLSAPPGQSYPLFARLTGAPDVRALGLTLRWAATNSDAACFHIGPMPPTDGCGAIAVVEPAGSLDADSTYAWTITFADSVGRECVVYGVDLQDCPAGTEGIFYLTAARVVDSSGAIDELSVGTGAWIGRGTSVRPPFSVDHVIGRYYAPGETSTIPIVGSGFNERTTVTLQAGQQIIPADRVQLGANGHLYARVSLPAESNAYLVNVYDPDRDSLITAPTTVEAIDTTAARGNGRNGLSVHRFRTNGTGAHFYKPPGDTAWHALVDGEPPPELAFANAAPRAGLSHQRLDTPFAASAVDCSDLLFKDDFESGSIRPEVWTASTSSPKWQIRDQREEFNCTVNTTPFGRYGIHASNKFSCSDPYPDVSEAYLELAQPIALTGTGSCTIGLMLHFNVASANTNNDEDRFEVAYSINGGIWQTVMRINWLSSVQWGAYTFPLQALPSDELRLRLYFKSALPSTPSGAFGVLVDDVSISATQSRHPNLAIVSPTTPAAALIQVSYRSDNQSDSEPVYEYEPWYVDWAAANTSDQGAYCEIWSDAAVQGQQVVESLPEGIPAATTQKFLNRTLAGLAVGSYTVTVGVEAVGSGLPEQDYSDNQTSVEITVVRRPDLVVSIAPASAEVEEGGSQKLKVTITNQGGEMPNVLFRTHLYRKVPPALNEAWRDVGGPLRIATGDELMQEWFSSNLYPGTSREFEHDVATAVPGSEEYYAVVDALNVVDEEPNGDPGPKEANNTSNVVLVTVTPIGRLLSGRFVNRDSSEAVGLFDRPIVGARVEVLDGATGAVLPLQNAVTTNSNGEFGPVFVPGMQSSLAVRAVAERPRACGTGPAFGVRHTVSDELFVLASAPVTPTPGQVAINYGTITPTLGNYEARSAFHLFAVLSQGYDWVTSRDPGRCPGTVKVLWQRNANVTTLYNAQGKHILVGDARDGTLTCDTYDDGIILHEYAHALQDEYSQMARPPGVTHSWTAAVASSEKAFYEGWASAVACWMLGTGTLRDSGINAMGTGWTFLQVDLEDGAVTTSNGGPAQYVGMNGELWEMPWAGTCWDWADPVGNEPIEGADNVAVGVDVTWAALRGPLPQYTALTCRLLTPLAQAVSGQVHPPSGVYNDLRQVLTIHGIGSQACPEGQECDAVCFGVITDVPSGDEMDRLRLWPVPMRGVLEVAYSGSNDLEVEIFDVGGRRVWRAEDRSDEGGTGVVRWLGLTSDGQRAGNGVYFLHARVGGKSYVRRFAKVQ